MLQFCILFYANYTILATQRGDHGPMAPLNTPLVASNLAKNRENVKEELCLNVIIPFSITVYCLVVA